MLLAQAALCLLVAADEWRFDPVLGYVDADTGERKSPEQLFELGMSFGRERRTDEAVTVFELIAAHGPTPELKERAFFKRAEALWSGGRFEDAHQAYAAFALRHPESVQAEEAKEQAMACALRLAELGDPQTVFGLVTVAYSSKTGRELLREFLKRYPREKTSAKYYYLLGEFLVRQEEDEAEAEFVLLLQEYPGSGYAARALIHLAEIQMRRFHGVAYDGKPLREAKRHFARFLEEYGGTDETLTAKVRGEIARIQELLAEKEWRIGDYYHGRGYPRAAKMYFEHVVRTFPDTSWAERSRTSLKELAAEE